MSRIILLIFFIVIVGGIGDVVKPVVPNDLAVNVEGIILKIDPPAVTNLFTLKKIQKGKTVSICPRYDEIGSLVLGGMFRMLIPETLKVTDLNGREYIDGVDYALNTDWAKITALGNDISTNEVRITAQAAMQRIDLLQKTSDGKFFIKKGKSRMWCPEIPAVDSGCKKIAGIYVAPWRVDDQWCITEENIFPVISFDSVKPINPDSVSNTIAKLKTGKEVSIAFIGDSITLGAEAGQWWKDISRTFRGLVQIGLKEKYPDAEIIAIDAYFGGKGIDKILEVLPDEVLAEKPDVAIVALGVNDVWPGKDGKPKLSLEEFIDGMTKLIGQLKRANCEVVLVTEMQPNPFDPEGTAELWEKYVEAQRKIASSEDIALADVYTEWMNQQHNGVYPFSMLHNSINHPGVKGHKIFADVILDCF